MAVKIYSGRWYVVIIREDGMGRCESWRFGRSVKSWWRLYDHHRPLFFGRD